MQFECCSRPLKRQRTRSSYIVTKTSVLSLPIFNNLGEAKVSDLDASLSRDEKILCEILAEEDRWDTRVTLDNLCECGSGREIYPDLPRS